MRERKLVAEWFFQTTVKNADGTINPAPLYVLKFTESVRAGWLFAGSSKSTLGRSVSMHPYNSRSVEGYVVRKEKVKFR